MIDALASLLSDAAASLDVIAFEVHAVVAIGLVSVACGLVGPFIVGNRMAFFSDAMAHTAFAGAALGVLVLLLVFNPASTLAADADPWVIPAVMVAFGIVAGLGIAFVRDRTGLTADAVIGVFFALAIGFAAMLIPLLSRVVRFNVEDFLFGSPLFASATDIAFLILVVILSALFVVLRFNAMTLAGYNPSLARTRNVSVRLNSYIFIILLSLVVNLSIKAVGVMLINALLIVPAAAAANVARNVRQLFAISLLVSTMCGLGGYLISRKALVTIPGRQNPEQLGPSGVIIVCCVLVFFATAIAASLRGRRIHGTDCC